MGRVDATLSRYFLKNRFPRESSRKVVVVTGCDSGLGYSLSVKCKELGLTVVSGCLDLTSEGAKLLSERCHVYNLDVTDSSTVSRFAENVKNLTENGETELHAVVNNAGVMILGEYEWYTERQILQQVDVNLMGSFRIAKAFLPMLRKTKGRLINITSHCALTSLPNFTVYGATKAALQNWSDGLRMEQQKYGVKVISFMPGSFATQSNIFSAQASHSLEMEKAFSAEDRKLFGRYLEDLTTYLSYVSGERKPLSSIGDEKLYKKFAEALLHDNPRPFYKHEPWRYFFYYNSFRIAPLRLKDYLIKKFLKFPEYKSNPD